MHVLPHSFPSGNDMPPAQYLMACTGIGCDPKKGLSVGDLKLVYASGGADIGK